MKAQNCIIVMGMHRSGTSALAGLLYDAGLSIGKSYLNASFDNPVGFFENRKVLQLNDKLLNKIGKTWSSWDLKKSQLNFNLGYDDYINEGINIIKDEFKESPQFLIKDPRLSLLLPFWIKIFDILNISYYCIVSLRHPDEIALSLKERNNFDFDKTYLITSQYLLFAMYNLKVCSAINVAYEEVINNPIAVVTKIREAFKLDLTLSYTNEHIDKNLVHHFKESLVFSSQIRTDCIKLFDKICNTDTGSRESIALDLKKFEDQHNRHSKKYIANANESNYTKILYDFGQGYYSNLKQNCVHNGLSLRVSDIRLSASSPIQKIKIIPILKESIVGFRLLELKSNNEEIDYHINSNADNVVNNEFVFRTKIPQFVITIIKPNSIIDLSMAMQFMPLKLESSKKNDWNRGASKLSIILRSGVLILKSPLQFIKQLRPHNFKTLFSALSRESPNEIYKNFKKLLRGDDIQNKIRSISERNKLLFLRQKSDLDVQNRDNNFSIENRIQHKSIRILYVNLHLPEYDTSSGGHRATEIVKLLLAKCDVYLYSIKPLKEKYSKYFEDLGAIVIKENNLRGIKNLVPHFDTILYTRYFTFFEAPNFRSIYPNSLCIIDSEDVNWVREKRSIGLVEGLDTRLVNANKERELKAFNSADIIWTVSKADQDAVVSELPQSDVRIVSNIHYNKVQDYIDPNTQSILFIGGFRHYPNLSAVEQLAKIIFPLIREKHPDSKLIIAGAYAPIEVAELGNLDGVEFLGYIRESELKQLYSRCLMTIVPLIAGAGVKGKITEAISYKLPVVTNAVGNEGINLVHQESGFIVEEAQKMADVAIEIISGFYDLDRITANAQDKIKHLTSIESVESSIYKSICRPVSICIVTYNNFTLLKSCIESIIEFTAYTNYSILVYSNGCNDGTIEYLDELSESESRLIVIKSYQNDVFVKPNNVLFQYFKSNDVVMLNNDVVVTQGWLSALYSEAYYMDNTGIVGPKILYPNGSLQEFGSEIYVGGKALNVGKNDDPELKRYNRVRAVGYISGCCMYIKRSTINKIGVLDEQFHPLYYEDSDYCYTAWLNNMYSIVTPKSIVYHYEGATAGTDVNVGMKKYQSINKEKFHRKHDHHLKQSEIEIKKVNRIIERLKPI